MSGLNQNAIHEIIQRHSREQSVRGIARAMRVSRRAVQRVLDEHAAGREQGSPHPDMPRRRAPRGSALDAYDEPVYNMRFLAFATHYGFRPRACWPRRPQTKGKVERPFSYVELNLLNGRTFSTLEHLNETRKN